MADESFVSSLRRERADVTAEAARKAAEEEEALIAAEAVGTDANREEVIDTEPSKDGDDDEVEVVHLIEAEEVQRAASEYAAQVRFDKKHHQESLTCLPSRAAIVAVVPRGSRLPHSDARSVLVYTRARRGCVTLVHTRPEWCRRGYASLLAEEVKSHVPPDGSLSVNSPACTARAAVSLWLRAGFMGCESLLSCRLADDFAYVGGLSVQLVFTWQAGKRGKNGLQKEEEARICFLRKVRLRHPDLARVCEKAEARAAGC